jgi:nitrite reductase/ring-hydroxylating ferredoxin subunit
MKRDSCATACPIGRAQFLRSTALTALASVAGAALFADPAFAQSVDSIAPTRTQGKILTYAFPAKEGALIDADNGVILARVKSTLYALSIRCPHRALTSVEWLPDTKEFRCPKHDAHFQSDGELIEGRPDRGLDRYAARRVGQNIVVDTASIFQEDTAREAWSRAIVALG